MSKLQALEHFQLAMTELGHLMDGINKPFSIRDKVISHPAYNETVRRVATLHRTGNELKHGGGLLVTGHSGIGKTKVLNYYRDEFPTHDDGEGAVIPVLYVVTPAEPTVKNLAEAMQHVYCVPSDLIKQEFSNASLLTGRPTRIRPR